MKGDFKPGRLPLPRHVAGQDEEPLDEVVCGTCGEVPHADDLEPIERTTGLRSPAPGLPTFLEPYRRKNRAAVPWPRPTDPATCEECSGPGMAEIKKSSRKLCARCARFLKED